MTEVPRAATLSCTRCGGRFDVDPRFETVRCPYCGNHQALPAGFRRDAANYRADVASEIGRVHDAYQSADMWNRVADQNAPEARKRHMIPLGIAVLGTGLVIAVGMGAYALGWLSHAGVGYLNVLVGLTSYGGMLAYVVMYFSGQVRRRPRALHDVRIVCPNCGAPGALAVGQPAHACAYCHGALLATPQVMQDGVAEARRAHRQAAFDERRAERRAVLHLAAYQLPTRYVIAFVCAYPALAIPGAIAWWGHQMLEGSEPYNPAIFLALIFTLNIALGVVTILLVGRARTRARRETLFALAEQLGGYGSTQLEHCVGWLDRFWPAKFELQSLIKGSLSAIDMKVYGYPALLHWSPRLTNQRPAHLHALIAADIPPERAGGSPWLHIPEAEAAVHHCRQLGFQVEATDAGIHASADPSTRARIGRSVEDFDALGVLLARMSEIAYAVGAPPAQEAVITER